MSQHDIRNGHKISDNVIVFTPQKNCQKKVLYNSRPSLYKQIPYQETKPKKKSTTSLDK
jgi:hypothetical protein